MIGDNYQRVAPFDRWILNGNSLVGASLANSAKSEGRFLSTENAYAVAAPYSRRSAFIPYRVATYGDSRANLLVGEVAAANLGYLGERSIVQLHILRGDMKFVFNGGVSGDNTVNYNSAARIAGSQGITACIATTPDFVFVQYGINDNIAGTAAATTIANLKALIAEFIGSGIFVVFESINPCTPGPLSQIQGYTSGGGYSATTLASEYTVRLALTQACNAAMQDWLATFPGRALYVDTSGASTDQTTGYAKTDQSYSDGTHFSVKGGRNAARFLDEAIRPYFPRLRGKPIWSAYQNGMNDAMINVASGRAQGVNSIASESGSFTGSTYAVETDAEGEVVQTVLINPSALSSGYWRARIELASAFAGAASAVVVSAGDILQASVTVHVDNGSGGPPSAYCVLARAIIYYDDASNEYVQDGYANILTSTDHLPIDVPLTHHFILPRRAVKAAKGSANMLTVAGSTNTALCILAVGNTLAPTRIRIKRPTWVKVA